MRPDSAFVVESDRLITYYINHIGVAEIVQGSDADWYVYFFTNGFLSESAIRDIYEFVRDKNAENEVNDVRTDAS